MRFENDREAAFWKAYMLTLARSSDLSVEEDARLADFALNELRERLKPWDPNGTPDDDRSDR